MATPPSGVPLAAWQAFIARLKWERVVVARFAKKMSQRCELSCFAGWLDRGAARQRLTPLPAPISDVSTQSKAFRAAPSEANGSASEAPVAAITTAVQNDQRQRRRTLLMERIDDDEILIVIPDAGDWPAQSRHGHGKSDTGPHTQRLSRNQSAQRL